MSRGSRDNRGLQQTTKANDASRIRGWALNRIDPEGLRYLATISVRAHWFIAVIASIELVYRPYLVFGVGRYATMCCSCWC